MDVLCRPQSGRYTTAMSSCVERAATATAVGREDAIIGFSEDKMAGNPLWLERHVGHRTARASSSRSFNRYCT
jgi:hypothetical protein